MSELSLNRVLAVRTSPIHGRGLFSCRDIAAGTLLGVYEGTPTRRDGTHVLWVQEDGEQWIGYDGTNVFRFMNHSARPNCEMDGQECWALRNIRENEEITIDYGEEWHDEP